MHAWMGHIKSSDLKRYLANEGIPAWRMGAELHLESCADCGESILEIKASSDVQLAATRRSLPRVFFGVKIGSVIDGRYRVDGFIGQGGMGTVFEGYHLHLKQRVALKFILPELAQKPEIVARFQREGRAASRLMNENTCRVIDLGNTGSGAPFLVLEYLQGESIDERLRRVKCMPSNEVIALAIQLLRALDEAHEVGIVHRDIKPANLFLAKKPDGTELLKVLDFGIAKSVNSEIEEGLSTTAVTTLVGSPHFMAPEQTNFRSVDARTDIWSVGVTLFQMLTGKLPFAEQDVGELFESIRARPLVDEKISDLTELERVVRRCLEKDPVRRFQSAKELSNALVTLVAPSATPPDSLATIQFDSLKSEPEMSREQPAMSGANTTLWSRKRWRLVVAMGVVSSMAASLVWQVTRPAIRSSTTDKSADAMPAISVFQQDPMASTQKSIDSEMNAIPTETREAQSTNMAPPPSEIQRKFASKKKVTSVNSEPRAVQLQSPPQVLEVETAPLDSGSINANLDAGSRRPLPTESAKNIVPSLVKRTIDAVVVRDFNAPKATTSVTELAVKTVDAGAQNSTQAAEPKKNIFRATPLFDANEVRKKRTPLKATP
jgi:serine/threonine protein kinase